MNRTPIALALFASGLALTSACGGTCEEEGTCAQPAPSASDTSGDTSASTSETPTGNTQADTTSGPTGPAVEVVLSPEQLAQAKPEDYVADGRYNLALSSEQTAAMLCESSGERQALVAADGGILEALADAAPAILPAPSGDGGEASSLPSATGDAGSTETATTGDLPGAEAGAPDATIPCVNMAGNTMVVTNEGSIGTDPDVPDYTFGEKCLRVDVPYTDHFQFFEFQAFFNDEPLDLEGYDLFVPIKLIDVAEPFMADCAVGQKFYAKSGADWVYGSAGWQNAETADIGNWTLLKIDTSGPEDVSSGLEFKADEIMSIGVGFDSACDAATDSSINPGMYSFCVGEVVKVLRK